MSTIKLDLSGFNHVKSDKDTTTLKHGKMGHTVVLVHKTLSPDNQKLLKAMACGGDVKKFDDGGKVPAPSQGSPGQASSDKQQRMQDVSNVEKTGTSSSQSATASKYIQQPSSIVDTLKNAWAEGGKVQRYAEGEEVNKPIDETEMPPSSKEDDLSDDADLHHRVAEMNAVSAQKLKTKPKSDKSDMKVPATAEDQAVDQQLQNTDQAGQQAVQAQPQPQSAQDTSQTEINQAAQQAQGQQNQQPLTATTVSPSPNQQAAQQVQQAEQQNQIPRVTVAPADYSNLPQALRQQYEQEDRAWEHDLNNGHITPETAASLYAKKDTPQKIATIMGLLIGGAGSGLTHTPNAAMQMIQQELDADNAAAKTSVENAKSARALDLTRRLNNSQIEQNVKEGKLTDQQAAALRQTTEAAADVLHQTVINRNALHQLMTTPNPYPPGSQAYQQIETAKQNAYLVTDQKLANLKDNLASVVSSTYKGVNMPPAFWNNQPGHTQAQPQETAAQETPKSLQQPKESPDTVEDAFKQRQDYLMKTGHSDIARDEASKHLSGVGDGEAISSDDRARWQQLQNLHRSYLEADRYLKNTTAAQRANPLSDAHKLGADLASQLTTTVGHLNELPGFRKEEIEYYKGQVPALIGMKEAALREDPIKVKNLIDRVTNEKATFLKTHNLPIEKASEPPPEVSAAVPGSQTNSSAINPNADKIKMYDKWLSNPKNATDPKFNAVKAARQQLG